MNESWCAQSVQFRVWILTELYRTARRSKPNSHIYYVQYTDKHIIWLDITGTVQYSAVITCKRQFVGMLAQLAKASFGALTTSFAFGEKLFLGLLRLKISSFVESKPIPIALFLVFTVLTLALNSKVISTAMSVQLHERRSTAVNKPTRHQLFTSSPCDVRGSSLSRKSSHFPHVFPQCFV